MIRRMAWGVALWALAGASGPALAAAVVDGFNATTLPRSDDGSSAAVPLGFEVDLYGVRYANVFVNTNGNISFGKPNEDFDPQPLRRVLVGRQLPLIAPFYADVDTSFRGAPVTYGAGTYDGKPAFGVNWVDVSYFQGFTDQASARNNIQLILVSRADRAAGDFDIVFNYDRVLWEAGTASGAGDDGRGGSAARAGFALAAGVPGAAFELQGSAVNGALLNGGPQALVAGRRNSEVAGRYVFEVRSDQAAQVSARTPFADADAGLVASDASGRFLVFQSASNSLSADDGNPGSDVFRLDTHTGELEVVSVDFAGAPLTGSAVEPAISADGQRLLFVAADASVGNRPDGVPGGGVGVYLRDLASGSTHRLGSGLPGSTGTLPRLSASGSHAVWVGRVTDSAEGAVGQDNIYRVAIDLAAEEPAPPQCVSCKTVDAIGTDTGNNVNGNATAPDISGDGSVVVWESRASNPLTDASSSCAGALAQVLRRDLRNGQLSVVNQPAGGGSCGTGGRSGAPRIDQAGRRLVFESDMPLLAEDSNAVADIYGLETGGSLQRLSKAADGAQGNGGSTAPAISGDGQVVAFASLASNLDAGQTDSNNASDIHVRAIQSGALRRLAATDTGAAADQGGRRPSLDFDGTLLAFEATSANLAAGAVAGRQQIYQRSNPLASPLLRSATWWKPTESGWGLFIFDQGSLLAPAWFTYDTDGEPTWFLAAGAFPQPDGSYRGDLFRFTGVPFDRITGNAIVDSAAVGDLQLRFTGDSALRFDYRVGTVSQSKQLERFPFGTRTIACRGSAEASRAGASNYSDVWYGGTQSSGWGLFLNHVDNGLFAVWYTYDSDGEPVFLLVLTERQADGSFAGNVFRQRNGVPFSQIDNLPPSANSDVIGTARFRFSAGNAGVFSYRIGAVDQSKPIERLLVGDLPTECASADAN